MALTGAVDTRAIYELKGAQEPLRDVLRYAGGAPVLANLNKVQLERIDPSQPKAARFVEEFSLDTGGLGKTLRDGDVLTLLEISPKFANAVTLKGHVAQPLRYPYKPGMRIRDLIPDREALISPDFYRRKNLLVQVIERTTRAAPDAATATAPIASIAPTTERHPQLRRTTETRSGATTRATPTGAAANRARAVSTRRRPGQRTPPTGAEPNARSARTTGTRRRARRRRRRRSSTN